MSPPTITHQGQGYLIDRLDDDAYFLLVDGSNAPVAAAAAGHDGWRITLFATVENPTAPTLGANVTHRDQALSWLNRIGQLAARMVTA